MPTELIVALGYQKKAATITNIQFGKINNKIGGIMSYSSIWIMKPTPGKSKESQQVLKKMSEHWKRHGI